MPSGKIKCWGSNNYGQFGDGIANRFALPATVASNMGYIGLASGRAHNCAITNDREVSCWGDTNYNVRNHLGRAYPLRVSSLADVISVGSGEDHSCALTTGGSIKCWGAQEDGMLGNGNVNTGTIHSATSVDGINNAASLTVGGYHSCALLEGGSIKCWGRNSRGQLGRGNKVNGANPEIVQDIDDAVSLSAGLQNTCAVLEGGTVKCWGWVKHIFGVSPGSSSVNDVASTPVSVPDLIDVKKISLGNRHICALSNLGKVSCLGFDFENMQFPQNWNPIDIVSGEKHSCALFDNGTVECWGGNAHGQLGSGVLSALYANYPIRVKGISKAVSLSSGGHHSCAVLESGVVQCWGSNSANQLGLPKPQFQYVKFVE